MRRQRDHRFDKMGRSSPRSRRVKEMARRLPKTPDQWLKEILLALKDAREAKPFARLTGTKLTDADLFHLAPLVCLKFRGRKLAGAEADRVTKGALANVRRQHRKRSDIELPSWRLPCATSPPIWSSTSWSEHRR